MKKYKVGAIIMKAMPPHAGHLYLIRTALEQCEHVILLCCTLKTEPIDGRLRYSWLLETFWKHVQDGSLFLDHVEEDVPQYPYENPKFWDIWEHLIKDHIHGLKKINAFFTSESYGDTLAEIFKCDHVCVDVNRIKYPVSGTKIRSNPKEYQKHISSSIAYYYTPKIVLAGPESVGKSTYSTKLASELKLARVEEFGRTHYENLMNEQKPFTKFDIGLIAGGQLTLEQERYEQSSKMNGLICDTDLVATEIFSYFFFKSCPQWIKQHNRTAKYALTILLTPDVKYHQDGTRVWKDRWQHFGILEEFYKSSKRPYVIVSGPNHEDRYQKCKEWVKQVL